MIAYLKQFWTEIGLVQYSQAIFEFEFVHKINDLKNKN